MLGDVCDTFERWSGGAWRKLWRIRYAPRVLQKEFCNFLVEPLSKLFRVPDCMSGYEMIERRS